MTETRRKERSEVLTHVMRHGVMSKTEITKIIGKKRNVDSWLADNCDLPFYETDGGNIKPLRQVRRRTDPLIRDINTNGLGGIHAARG